MLGSLLQFATAALSTDTGVTEKEDATASILTSGTASTNLLVEEEQDQEKATIGKKGKQSWRSLYTSPPPVKTKYKQEEALNDLPGISYALQLFLESHMLESEEFCHQNDPNKERLYFATGFALIQCVKGLMSFEDADLIAAQNHGKQGNLIADLHRKKQAFFGSRMAGYVVSAVHSNPVAFIRSMTSVERHAELVYAESLFEKALLGIVYSGDWLAFIKEALNMRTIVTIYRQLGQFLEVVDAEAVERGDGPIDKTIDAHFRSGVYLGVGMLNLVLSLMPGRLMTLVELFGYHGDRKLGLEMLAKAGGWTKESDEPAVSAADEGIRRSICDMVLMIFHLVISSFTFDLVDISMARKVLDWNLKRFPNGVFFLFGAGRLAIARSQPALAIHYYKKAMESQSQYRNLHHISYWEMAIANFSLWDLRASLECWRELEREATWSKAIYTYGLAICMVEAAEQGETEGGEGTKQAEELRKEAIKLMKKVPELRQKIAGKSIPLEKLVARKARKFESQKSRLALPVLELSYIFQGIQHSPRSVITSKILPVIAKVLAKISTYEKEDDKAKAKGYEAGTGGYYDDLCLAKFLEGVCLRYVAYPDPDSAPEDEEESKNQRPGLAKEEAEKKAEAAFRSVFENGPKIEFDHHIVYHAHYELGRLLGCQGKEDDARAEFELVLSGRHLEVGPSGKKGKYSLENALHMRAHAANDALHHGRL